MLNIYFITKAVDEDYDLADVVIILAKSKEEVKSLYDTSNKYINFVGTSNDSNSRVVSTCARYIRITNNSIIQYLEAHE
jgi:endonuclease V-like protein UPF0215 family